MKQLSHGLQFQSAYTWGKLIDDTQGQTSGDSNFPSIFGSDPNHKTVDRGVADFDITQNWRFSAIYQLPKLITSTPIAQVVNGWRLTGILSLQSGYPFTPTLGSNRSRSGVNSGAASIDRPNLIAGRNSGNTILGNPIHYFDVTAFALQDAGLLGNAGRTILRGPGLENLDFSVVKEMGIPRLRDSGKLEFRAEAFNILNRANFGMPNRTVFSGTGATAAVPLATAGQITNTSTPSRQVQFALRLFF